ncbi:MAG: nucleotidyltransferase substrate binding protein [Hydrogenophaga sp.]|nr:nucleotidyltransferase substrate binding protein [Hydrogenophaga sp.]
MHHDQRHSLAAAVSQRHQSPAIKGYTGLIGSRDATRTAFKNGLIADGETWMDMIKARNQTSHTYNLAVAERIAQDIVQRFYPAFVALENTLRPLCVAKMSRAEEEFKRLDLGDARINRSAMLLARAPGCSQGLDVGTGVQDRR